MEKLSFYPPTSTEQNGSYMFKAMASFFSSLLLDIFTYHFTWWKLVDKNSIVSSYMGINAITNVGISLVTVGKKYLSNQNVSSESLCQGGMSTLIFLVGEMLELEAYLFCPFM